MAAIIHSTGNNTTDNMKPIYEILMYKCGIYKPEKIIFIIFYVFIIILGIFGNTLVIIVFFPFKKKTQKAYNTLIWYLGLFDLLATLIIIPEVYEYITCYHDWNFGWFGCKLIYSTYYVTINLSICMLCFISIDRYRNIVTPFKERFYTKDIHGSVFIAILLCFTMQWYQFHELKLTKFKEINTQHCIQNKYSKLYTIPRTVTILVRDVTFLVIFGMTTLMIQRTLLKRAERLRRSSISSTSLSNHRTFTLVLVMGTTFSILVLPYDIWDLMMLISRMLPVKYHIRVSWHLEILDQLLSILQMSNVVSNFLIFAFKHKKFRSALSFKLLVKINCFRQHEKHHHHVIRSTNHRSEYDNKQLLTENQEYIVMETWKSE